MEGLYWLMIIAALIIYIAVAAKFNNIACDKGHDGYFAWCFFTGIAGWLMVVALPDISVHKYLQNFEQKLTQQSQQPTNTNVTTQKNTNNSLPEL